MNNAGLLKLKGGNTMNTRICMPLLGLFLLSAAWTPSLRANDHTGKLNIENNCVYPLYLGFEGKNISVSNHKSSDCTLEIAPNSRVTTVLKEKTYKLLWAGERKTVSVKVKDDQTTNLNLTRHGYDLLAEVNRDHRVREKGVLVSHSPPPPAGHFEIQREQVLVSPAHYETRTTPAVYENRRGHRGKFYLVMVQPAQTVRVWVPDQYEIREAKVWVQASPVCAPPAAYAHRISTRAYPVRLTPHYSTPTRSNNASCASDNSRSSNKSNAIKFLFTLF